MNKIFLFLIFTLLPTGAYAHTGALGGFQAGLSHPVLGLDHLLAMISVGVVSAQLGGRAMWLIPSTFVLVMAIGGLLGMADVGLGAVEVGIALSVVVLGLAIANISRIAAFVIYGFVFLFATFHGYAHGLEIPQLATSWAYVGGFMLGTVGLHLLGVGIGHFASKIPNGPTALKYAGAIVAGMGLHILAEIAGI